MKIRTIHIKNYLGIEEVEINPGALTIIQGKNAAGKTSILEAIKSTVGSGHDPSVIRRDQDKAEVKILMEDGATIRMVVTPKSTRREITDEKGRKITRSAEWIKSILVSLSVDPIRFITASPKERLEALLNAMPLSLTAQDLTFLPVGSLDGISLDGYPLDVLAKISRGIYDERTGLNRAAKEKKATASQMSESLPEEPKEGNWSMVAAQAKDEYNQLKIDGNAKADAIKQECQDKKDAIEAELQRDIERLHTDAAIAKTHADKARDTELDEIRVEYAPKLQSLNDGFTRAQTMLEQQAKCEQTKEFIAEQKNSAKELEKQAEKLTWALTNLDELKEKMLQDVPIRGLEISDGQILIKGVPFDKVNKAQQIKVALEIARLRAGDLPLILVDDAEHFDSLNMEQFCRAVQKSGLQVIAAKVSDTELEVAHG